MRCKRCNGLIIDEYGPRRCINCGYDPDMKASPTPCQFQGCREIPVHGTICTHHLSQAETRRRASLKNLAAARLKRHAKEPKA